MNERDEINTIRPLDWGRITRKLCNRAGVYMCAMPQVFNAGKSSEDVVQDLLIAFFASENHLGWNPIKSPIVQTQGLESGLLVFLGEILAKRMVDQHRAYKRRVYKPIDACSDHGFMKDGACSPEAAFQFAEMQTQLTKKAEGNEIIQKMIKAAPEITGTGKVDQDLAELVTGDRTATSKIVNARKRFLRSEKRT